MTTRSWADIADFYLRVGPEQTRVLGELAKYVQARYDGLLFAATSMHTLLVSNVRDFEWDQDVLRINVSGDEATLEHRPARFGPASWSRRCPARLEPMIERFDSFVAVHRWLVRYDRTA